MSGEENAPASGAAPQCHFFVQRKKRLCRMTVKPGRRYCGEHEPQPTTEAGQMDKRIPCPNDPKHTCYSSKLLKHLAICNARQTEQPPYIVHNINAPEEAEPCPRRPLSAIPKEELMNVVDKVNRLYAKHVEGQISEEPTPPIHRAVLSEFNEEGRSESSRRHLRQVSALLALAERAGLARERTCYVELGAGKGQLSYYACHAWCGDGSSRVLAVDRAPLRHKRDNKLRSAPPASNPHGDPASTHTAGDDDSNRHSNEFENNKINASDAQQTVDSSDNQINPENDATNHSSDSNKVTSENTDQKTNMNSSAESDTPNSKCKRVGDGTPPSGGDGGVDEGEGVAVRVRADLAHLALAAVPAVAAARHVVGLAKHLCGVATDYALRCVAAAGVVRAVRGVVLATCCHHRVERAPYVGARHLQELGITAQELNVMLGIVSWATCGDGRSRERRALDGGAEPARAHDMSHESREEVGRRAKALVDWGRVLWLRARGFEARLLRFVAARVSPENLAILATR